MATKKTYTKEQKTALVEKYKSRYIAAPRSYANGQKVTEEIFNSLSKSDQWHRIYMNYVRKIDVQENLTTKPRKISFAKIRAALNTIKNSVDYMSDNQLQKTFAAFDEIKQFHDEKISRLQEEKVKELENKETQLKAQLEKIKAEKLKLVQ